MSSVFRTKPCSCTAMPPTTRLPIPAVPRILTTLLSASSLFPLLWRICMASLWLSPGWDALAAKEAISKADADAAIKSAVDASTKEKDAPTK